MYEYKYTITKLNSKKYYGDCEYKIFFARFIAGLIWDGLPNSSFYSPARGETDKVDPHLLVHDTGEKGFFSNHRTDSDADDRIFPAQPERLGVEPRKKVRSFGRR